ncbi:MAG TPA: signal peptidase I [Patescibacteria group bacterium]|nr:signal peptidase I [Patescibacteria group bacterium]
MAEHPQTSASGEVRPPDSGWLPHEVRRWLRDLAVALALAMFIVVFLYQPVKVEGTSMAPGISNQERIFINKFVYHFEPIRRGDVVVFWYPLDPSKSFIKRVIGLPGDTVTIRSGHVYINGREIREPYILPRYLDDDSYPPVHVPAGEYYVMGDHRDSSDDSRVFGPVPRRYIYGKAVFAYWPVDRFGSIGEVSAAPGK